MPRGKAKFATMDLNLGSDARDVTLVNPNIPDETPIVGTKEPVDMGMALKELDEDIEVKTPTFQQAQRVMETLNKLPSRSGKVLEKIKNVPQGTLSMPKSLKGEFQPALDADAKRLGKYRKAANKVMDRVVGIKELSDDIIMKGITKRQVWDKVVDIADRAAPGALTFGTLGYLGLRQTQDKNVRIKIGQDNPQPPTAIKGRGKMKKLGKRIREELTPPPIQVKVEKVEKGVFQQVIAGAKSVGRDFNEINRATGRFAKQHKVTAGTLAAAKVATWVPALTAAANAAGIPIPMVTMGLKKRMSKKGK